MKIPRLYKTAFFSATTLVSASLPTFGTLVSYYNFDAETNGDQFGSNDGQVNSQTGYTVDTPDGSAKSLDLSGTGVDQDYVRLGEASPNSPDFGISATNSFTISMWVNYTFSERGIVTIKQDLTGGGGDRSGVTFGLNSSGNPFLGLIQSSGGDDSANSLATTFHDVTTDQVVATSTWTHMAVTYDSLTDQLQIYVDGTAATTYTDGNAASSMTATGGSLTGGVGVIDFVDANGSFTGFGASGNAPTHGDSAGDFTRLFYDGLLDDVAIWDGALSASDVARLASGTKPPGLVTDTDGDGMSDFYENQFAFLSPTDPNDADLDEDTDDLSNLREFQLGTDPDNEDTDDDGLSDGEEVETYNTKPLVADTDGDLILDGQEVIPGDDGFITDPLLADTDGDTIPDGEEVIPGDDGYETNPLLTDTDADTFDDNVEIAAGTDPTDDEDFPVAIESGLISYYDFNDGLTVTDQISSNDGSVISDAGFSDDTPDGSAKSLDLSGSVPQDYVRLGLASPSGPDFGIATTNDFTISMWVNYTFSARGIVTIKQDLTSVGGDRSGVTFGLNPSGNPFLGLVHSSGGDDSANSLATTWHDVATDQVVATSTWTHMAVTYDSLTDLLQIYVDGTAATTYTDSNGASSMTATGGSLTGGVGVIDFVDANGSFTGFGAAGNAPQHSSSAGDFTRSFYDGLLDEVGIWNSALNADEIAALAAGASPPNVGGGITPLKITAVDFDFPASSVTLTWTSRPGRIYVLESSPDLGDGNWAEIDDNIPSQGTTTTYIDTNLADPAAVPKLFFRIRELP